MPANFHSRTAFRRLFTALHPGAAAGAGQEPEQAGRLTGGERKCMLWAAFGRTFRAFRESVVGVLFLCAVTRPPFLPAQSQSSPPQTQSQSAQGQSLPAQPADQQPAGQSSPQTTPPVDEQQQPAPGAPAAQAASTPGLIKVPKAVPSRMPRVAGEEIDRVVAIVNGQIVLDSDVSEEKRFESIQPYPGTDPNQTTREREIERLVNRDLILQQAKLETQESVSDADVTKEIAKLRSTLPGCKAEGCASEAAWAHYLAQHGFTVQEFQSRWKQRMQVLAFIDERFGAGTTVTEGQVREFYQNTMLPQYKKAGVRPAPFHSVEGRIRGILQQQQVSSLLRDWLQSLRAQGSITILHPGEEAP